MYRGHTGPVTCLAFHDKGDGAGDSAILITGSWDQVSLFPRWIRLLMTGYHRRSSCGTRPSVFALLLTATLIPSPQTKECISTTPAAHSDFVKTLFVLPSLQLLVSGGSDKIVRFWCVNPPTSHLRYTFLKLPDRPLGQGPLNGHRWHPINISRFHILPHAPGRVRRRVRGVPDVRRAVHRGHHGRDQGLGPRETRGDVARRPAHRAHPPPHAHQRDGARQRPAVDRCRPFRCPHTTPLTDLPLC